MQNGDQSDFNFLVANKAVCECFHLFGVFPFFIHGSTPFGIRSSLFVRQTRHFFYGDHGDFPLHFVAVCHFEKLCDKITEADWSN